MLLRKNALIKKYSYGPTSSWFYARLGVNPKVYNLKVPNPHYNDNYPYISLKDELGVSHKVLNSDVHILPRV
ncbi:hypothetical protein [Acetilactobacillus jinshanensis]|uniref:Uncharacterized protein n=1 Tax=Acetilactobacillus jinshanensis TaxID=1720083 RepID=A0A4P6ZKM6_9LACO|nr:hypothetical protein [Acetilactobacillus jinshanensis]QBP18244.1 hypothetical protein ELX58_03640 [Acetilactobacillus jinshanensis]URL61114.1 hypothetical protein HGK75_03715 [uncultured bacterium]